MVTHNTISIGNSLQDIQKLVRTKTQYQSLREATGDLMDGEMKRNVDNFLSKIKDSDEDKVALEEREEKAIKILFSKLSTVDSELNRAIRNHTKNMFGNYQGRDFGAHR